MHNGEVIFLHSHFIFKTIEHILMTLLLKGLH